MKKTENNQNSKEAGQAHIGEFRRIVRTMAGRPIVIIGMVVIIINIVCALFAPLIAPYDPNLPSLSNALQGPSWDHPLGTDTLGRDTLSRLIFGARTSMIIGISSVAISMVLGISLGLIAGYFGGFINTAIMRFIDAFMAFPMIMLIFLIASILGQGLLNICVSLGISMMAGYARLVCGQVISVKENDYIMAERSLGSGSLRVMLKHILPNCMAPIIVTATMMLGSAILAEAGLSFLGIGINPPTAAWGAMVNNGYGYILRQPLLSFVPGIAIMLVVFAFNMVGDGLRDSLDPRLRGTL